MTTKRLIYSIIGIFIITTGAYIVISPIATRTLDAPVVENYQEDSKEDQEATTTQEVKQTEIQTTTTIKPTTTTSQPSTQTPAPTTPVTAPPLPPDPVASGYTSSEVALHSTESSCWSIVNGIVYDLTAYVPRHPGGAKNIMRICGKDGTSAFEGQHGGESKPEKILASYKIGVLK